MFIKFLTLIGFISSLKASTDILNSPGSVGYQSPGPYETKIGEDLEDVFLPDAFACKKSPDLNLTDSVKDSFTNANSYTHINLPDLMICSTDAEKINLLKEIIFFEKSTFDDTSEILIPIILTLKNTSVLSIDEIEKSLQLRTALMIFANHMEEAMETMIALAKSGMNVDVTHFIHAYEQFDLLCTRKPKKSNPVQSFSASFRELIISLSPYAFHNLYQGLLCSPDYGDLALLKYRLYGEEFKDLKGGSFNLVFDSLRKMPDIYFTIIDRMIIAHLISIDITAA